MHSHYCPSCGQGLQARGGSRRVPCSRCSVEAEHSGTMLMLCGFIVAFVGGLTSASLVAAIAGGGFFVIGVIRRVRQFQAAKHYASRYKDA